MRTVCVASVKVNLIIEVTEDNALEAIIFSSGNVLTSLLCGNRMHAAREKGLAETNCGTICPVLDLVSVWTDAFLLVVQKKRAGHSLMAKGVRT